MKIFFRIRIDSKPKMYYNLIEMKKENQKLSTLVVRVRNDQRLWVESKASEGGLDVSKFVRVMIDSFKSLESESKK